MATLNLIFIKSPCVPLFQRGSGFLPLFSKEGLEPAPACIRQGGDLISFLYSYL
jgi:hypothetical protein